MTQLTRIDVRERFIASMRSTLSSETERAAVRDERRKTLEGNDSAEMLPRDLPSKKYQVADSVKNAVNLTSFLADRSGDLGLKVRSSISRQLSNSKAFFSTFMCFY
jgi:hypothetical protein